MFVFYRSHSKAVPSQNALELQSMAGWHLGSPHSPPAPALLGLEGRSALISQEC